MMSKGVFREGRGCVGQIFTLKQIGEKAREKKRRLYVGFINLEKTYDTVNKEILGQVLIMYDVWHSAMVKHGCVSPRILWIKFKFQGLKFVWWSGTAPM